MTTEHVWTDGGFSASAGQHIQYATCPDYPGVSRITCRYAYEDTLVEYVVSGRTRPYKTPEAAARAAARVRAQDAADLVALHNAVLHTTRTRGPRMSSW